MATRPDETAERNEMIEISTDQLVALAMAAAAAGLLLGAAVGYYASLANSEKKDRI